MVVINGHVDPREIVGIGISIALFGLIMRFVVRIFVGRGEYANETVGRYINIIFYILLGTYFCYFASFISKPALLISYTGLLAALYLCFSVMLRAISRHTASCCCRCRCPCRSAGYGPIR